MTEISVAVNQTTCQIFELDCSLFSTLCDRCQRPVPYLRTIGRTAIDLHLDHPENDWY